MNDPFAPEKKRAHLKALWDAYFEATGLPTMFASYDRLQALRRLDQRGVTAEDVRTVVRWVRTQMNAPRSNFTSTALDWRNLMDRTDAFEEHLAKARQSKQRRPKSAATKSEVRAIAPVDQAEQERLRAKAKTEAEEFRRRMGL